LGDTEAARKYHAVGWDVVTTLKWLGGLGLRKLDNMNKACILKLGWKIYSGANDFWCQVRRGKYGCNSLKTFSNVRVTDSSLWKAIVKPAPHLNNYGIWTVGDGKEVEAWNHMWIEVGLTISEMHINVPVELQGVKVCDLVDAAGNWNWALFQGWMPQEILQKIAAILPPNVEYGPDIQLGSGANQFKFFVAIMYELLCNFDLEIVDDVWMQIWKLNVPERVRSFMWLLRHDRLLTNFNKSKMGLGHAMCSHCRDIEETSLHVFRDCHYLVKCDSVGGSCPFL
jgi:hypothetical protein